MHYAVGMAGHTTRTTTGLIRVQNASRTVADLDRKLARTGWLSTAEVARRANAKAILNGAR